MKTTPMMQQYHEVKRGLPRDTLLLFRLGDFFELFFDDAILASKLLGLTLTKRLDHPMCGLPSHALDTYVGKLLAAGKKVAICDQSEPATFPANWSGASLTRILSPGTTLAANQLDAQAQPLPRRLRPRQARTARRLARPLDGRVPGGDRSPGGKPASRPHRPRSRPSLILDRRRADQLEGSPARDTARHALQAFCATGCARNLPAYQFDVAAGSRAVMEALGVLQPRGVRPHRRPPRPRSRRRARPLRHRQSLRQTGEPARPAGVSQRPHPAARSVDPAQPRDLPVEPGHPRRFALRRHQPHHHPDRRPLLERWLAAPPLSLDELVRRQSLVGELRQQPTGLGQLRDALGPCATFPASSGACKTVCATRVNSAGVRDTLVQLPALRHHLSRSAPTCPPSPISPAVAEFPELRTLLQSGLADELPADLARGKLHPGGYDAELDRLRALTSGNKTWLSDLESHRTGTHRHQAA
jgi:DNA mismatch repair protein MutS